MTRDKLIELLQGLKAATEQSKLQWQDLPDEEMFRAHVGSGMVRIGRSTVANHQVFTLWVMSPTGAIAAQLDIWDNDIESDFKLIETVYSLARLAARGGDSLLDSMLNNLPKVSIS
jgi:hypothetical protein